MVEMSKNSISVANREIISLRDQIAIAALQGLLSSKPFNKVDITKSAYEYADEMLRARE